MICTYLKDYMHKAGDQKLQLAMIGIDARLQPLEPPERKGPG